MLVAVLVERWQIDCCGPRFGLGDVVAWKVLFSPLDDRFIRGWPSDGLIDLPARGWRQTREVDSGWVFDCATLAPGIEVAYPHGTRPGDRLHGLLSEDHHAGAPDTLPAPRATVRRIRIATRELRLDGGMFSPHGSPVELTDVRHVPGRFNPDQAVAADRRIVTVGVLADIEIPPPDPDA